MVKYLGFSAYVDDTVYIVGKTVSGETIKLYSFYRYRGNEGYAEGRYLVSYEEKGNIRSYPEYREVFNRLYYRLLCENEVNDILRRGFSVEDLPKSCREFLISYEGTSVMMLEVLADYLYSDYMADSLALLGNRSCSDYVLEKYSRSSYNCLSSKAKRLLNTRKIAGMQCFAD